VLIDFSLLSGGEQLAGRCIILLEVIDRLAQLE
jgi:hypothetical protein